MNRIWNLKIRKSIQKEFPGDPMMQELHELRLQKPFSKTKQGISSDTTSPLAKELKRVGLVLRKTRHGYYAVS